MHCSNYSSSNHVQSTKLHFNKAITIKLFRQNAQLTCLDQLFQKIHTKDCWAQVESHMNHFLQSHSPLQPKYGLKKWPWWIEVSVDQETSLDQPEAPLNSTLLPQTCAYMNLHTLFFHHWAIPIRKNRNINYIRLKLKQL